MMNETETEMTNDTDMMLTTLDNPFDPFTQYDDWNRFDCDNGYYTMNYIARIAVTTDELSEAIYNAAINHAIDEICEINVTGNYKKVFRKIL